MNSMSTLYWTLNTEVVAAVGARWGYPDPAHFSRLFKASFGLSPRDYRASHGL
jgi:AraC-like DNA-binding protein